MKKIIALLLLFVSPLFAADLTVTGTTGYPTTIDSASSVAGGSIKAKQIDGPSAAIVALQTAIGTLPAGTSSSLSVRLSRMIAGNGALFSGTSDPVSPAPVNGQMFFRSDLGSIRVYNSVTGGWGNVFTLGAGAISNSMIQGDAVTSAKILDGTILAGDLSVGAVTTAGILNGTILAADLSVGAVTTAGILDGTILATDLSAGIITAAAIADGAITTLKILDGTILAADLSVGAVTTAGILDGTILAGDLSAGSVTTAGILDGTILAGDLSVGAVTTTGILDGTILAGDLSVGAVTTTGILDGTILAADLSVGAVTTAGILDGTILAADIAAGVITTPALLDGAVTSLKILDGTILSADMAAGSVTTTEILNSTILTADIAALQITDALIASITTRSKLPSQLAYEDEANTYNLFQTFNGGLSGTTGTFSGLLAANAGLSSTTGTFSTFVSVPTIFRPGAANPAISFSLPDVNIVEADVLGRLVVRRQNNVADGGEIILDNAGSFNEILIDNLSGILRVLDPASGANVLSYRPSDGLLSGQTAAFSGLLSANGGIRVTEGAIVAGVPLLAPNKSRVLSGSVGSNGTFDATSYSSTGWTVVRTGVGRYIITFTTPFIGAGFPVVLVSAKGTGALSTPSMMAISEATDTAYVIARDSAGVDIDRGFYFMAIGGN